MELNKNILLKNITLLSQQSDEEKAISSQESTMHSIKSLERIVDLVKNIVFPGYFDTKLSNDDSRYFNIGVNVEELFTLLKGQLNSDDKALAFIERLPEIKRVLYTDVSAMFHSDPAVTGLSEIIFCYPFVQVMIHYRMAHELLLLDVPIIPRIITEMAHSKTGIDIHPGATIGEYFCIDHGTGVVIGETCIIGNHVMLYQGVTLGAKSFTFDDNGTPLNTPRHPIIEDNVTIYSNSSILGRITIGHNTIIGGNVWLTHSVPPNSKILQSKAISKTFTDGDGI